MNKKILVLLLLLVTSLGFISGCTLVKSNDKSMQSSELEQKNKTVSLTGKLTKNGEIYLLTDGAGTIHDVETYSVNFDEYLNQTVQVSGQYSGNTLFVTEIIQ